MTKRTFTIRDISAEDYMFVIAGLYQNKARMMAEGKTPMGDWRRYDALIEKIENDTEVTTITTKKVR